MRDLTAESATLYTVLFVGGPLDGQNKTMDTYPPYYAVEVPSGQGGQPAMRRGYYHRVRGTDAHSQRQVDFYAYMGTD